jgi:UDP-glucose 6-dehydrogenase
MPKPQITIAGIGYVGLSNAVFLAQHNHATTLDIAPEKIRAIQDIINNLEKFKQDSTVIVDNRIKEGIQNMEEKVYTRDLFHQNV